MDLQLALILGLTFVIHLIGTLAYAFRIAGIRTGRIAVAFSLFNILVLVSRTSNSFQGPFLAKRVETTIDGPSLYNLQFDFMLIIATASAATLVGGLLIPTFQRYSTTAVSSFRRNRSVLRLLLRSVTPRGISLLVESAAVPSYQNLIQLRRPSGVPIGVILMNFAASALWTVGVLAAIYAGTISPELRVTSSTLSSVINGVATIMLFIMIDPYLAGLTDDTISGDATEGFFRKVVVWMIVSRLAGTIAAQFMLEPAAKLIALTARAL
ncbi:lipid II flippase Amj family protein [Kaistia terrae]|uniref:Lipid II flippase Amj n=1 Tax=Kaistia terrae TaxID=537017 RepID=A0ABW0PT91_9HYPH|nr:lipid II flippase Amj family protein [Kaistia terrae]MCX5577232.1 lipid II flippase Amj family protein [Kaistia terrae]